jgi:phosphoglucosamine mutase
MARTVRDEGADLGLAFDGDGDRLIVCDEKGQIVDGDCIMAICARELMGRGSLRKKTLVATVMSNMGLEIAIESMGGAWCGPRWGIATWWSTCVATAITSAASSRAI